MTSFILARQFFNSEKVFSQKSITNFMSSHLHTYVC